MFLLMMTISVSVVTLPRVFLYTPPIYIFFNLCVFYPISVFLCILLYCFPFTPLLLHSSHLSTGISLHSGLKISLSI
jgi:hypothetical protein